MSPFGSLWVLATDDEDALRSRGLGVACMPAEPRAGLRPWTDDFSSLLSVLQ